MTPVKATAQGKRQGFATGEADGSRSCDAPTEAVRRLPGLLLDRDLREHREVTAAELRRHVEHREAGGARPGLERVDLDRIDRVALRDPLLYGLSVSPTFSSQIGPIRASALSGANNAPTFRWVR